MLLKLILKAYEKVPFTMPGQKASATTSGKRLLQKQELTLNSTHSEREAQMKSSRWDFIDAGVTKEFLIREWKQAKGEVVTPNCRQKCAGCGARRYEGGVCYEGKLNLRKKGL